MTLEETVEKLDEAFNRRDIEAVLEFYEDDAVLVAEPNRIVQGKAAIRQTFEFVFTLNGTAKQVKTQTIESGELALFLSKWTFSGTLPDGTAFTRDANATCVFRKSANGAWRCVIDNSYGIAVLD
jgi:uncharacterized protein (TIGR02246 family)